MKCSKMKWHVSLILLLILPWSVASAGVMDDSLVAWSGESSGYSVKLDITKKIGDTFNDLPSIDEQKEVVSAEINNLIIHMDFWRTKPKMFPLLLLSLEYEGLDKENKFIWYELVLIYSQDGGKEMLTGVIMETRMLDELKETVETKSQTITLYPNRH